MRSSNPPDPSRNTVSHPLLSRAMSSRIMEFFRTLDWQVAARPRPIAERMAGESTATRRPMIATTTSNSIKVNPFDFIFMSCGGANARFHSVGRL